MPLAWLTILSSFALFALAWRSYNRPLALIGLAALVYFIVWHYLVLADPPSIDMAAERAGEAIWRDLAGSLSSIIPQANQTGRLELPVAIAAVVLSVGMSLFWEFWCSTSAIRPPDQPCDSSSVLTNALAVTGKVSVGFAIAALVMIIILRTAHDIDLAQVLAAALGERSLAMILIVAAASIGLSMLIPGLAAYLIAVALFGSALRTVGFDWLTTHLGLLAICMSAWFMRSITTRRSAALIFRPAV
jgi:TRAP-type uncharacterized transport system fused permease subunit